MFVMNHASTNDQDFADTGLRMPLGHINAQQTLTNRKQHKKILILGCPTELILGF